MKKRIRRKIGFACVTGVVLMAFFALAISHQWFLTWHYKFANFLFPQLEGQADPSIVIVAIDDKSLERKNASELRTLQFSKSDYARVLENMEREGVRAIGVDIIFSERSSDSDQSKLISVLRQYDNIVLAAEPKEDGTTGLKPLPEFVEARPGDLGSILFKADADSAVRRQQMVFGDPQSPYAFALQLVRKAWGLLPKDSQWLGANYELMTFPVREGGLKIEPRILPLDAQKRMLIHFFGPPGSFTTISFSDAFDGKMVDRKSGQPISLKDKIVLIGESGTALHDEQMVPTSLGHPMPGVEIHAHAVQTLLSGRFLREQGVLGTWEIVLFMVIVGLGVFLFVRTRISLLVLVGVWVLYMVVTWAAFSVGWILNTVYPYLALLLAFVVSYVYRYWTEARFARQTEQAFSKYVSHQVVQRILEHPEHLRLGGEKKEMTVLFSDIAGFTTISEKSEPEQLVNQLNEYLDSMTNIILDYDGTVDKYIGDAIMAFWGAPIHQKDHAVKACLAALDYQKRLAEMRPVWESKGLLPFSARIGINSGLMVVGNMGSHRRFDYTVIGDSVNLGARLEGVNKVFDTSILISETTYQAAKEHIEVRELDLLKVKGKTKPVRVYELLGRKGSLADAQKDLNHQFHQALGLYRQREWKKAIHAFEAILSQHPADGASKTYIERCGILGKADLPKGWDGSFELKTK